MNKEYEVCINAVGSINSYFVVMAKNEQEAEELATKNFDDEVKELDLEIHEFHCDVL